MRLIGCAVTVVALVFVVSGFGLVGAHSPVASSPNPAKLITAPSAGPGARVAHSLGPIRVGSGGRPSILGTGSPEALSVQRRAPLDARVVSTFLKVPDANPSNDSYYSVLMSVWDNSASYDQIGFTEDSGNWTYTISTTFNCYAATYTEYDVTALSPGTTYEFVMYLSTSGYVTFHLYDGSAVLNSRVVFTGASTFLVSEYHTCASTQYCDFTDSEVVQQTDQVAPDFSFHFVST